MSKQEQRTMLGKRIQQARNEQNMTREELAERAGISTTFCANLECGNKMVSVDSLVKLANALNVSADYLLGVETEDPHILSILRMLRDQKPETIAFVEKLVRLCISEPAGVR